MAYKGLKEVLDARLRFLLLPVFKTDGAPRKRALGGFDSRALPLIGCG